MLDFGSYDVLSFDCYGTLIDWEGGILAALGPVLDAHGVAASDATILETYARLESRAETGPYRSYRHVLRSVVEGFGEAFGFAPSESDRRSLEDSLPHWKLFPDTIAALAALGERYRLAVISNIDDDLFAGTAVRLGIHFDHVVTAQLARAYKPDPRVFHHALARIGSPVQRVLHIAQSLHHDIVPARSLGLATVWVNRRQGLSGAGATPPASAAPDLVVPDLRGLVAALGRQAGRPDA